MRKIFIVLVSVLMASSHVCAEKITAEIVELQTLQNNPSIAKAKYALDIAKQALCSSFSSFLPTISFSGSTGRDSMSWEHMEKCDYKRYNYGLNASLSLFSGLGDYNELKSSSASLKIAQEDYARAVSDAICTAHIAYVNLVWTYEAIDLYKQIKHRRTENRDLVKIRYRSGNADLGSLSVTEADVKMAEYELRKAQRAIETTSAALLLAIGRNDDITILETDERISIDKEIISKPDFDSLIIKIPEFLSAKYKLDRSRSLSWKQKRQWLPSIDFAGSINRERFARKSDETKSWIAALNLNYPLFSGGRRFFDTKSAVAQEKAAAEEFRNIKNLLKFSAVQHYNNLIDDYEILVSGNFRLESCKLQVDIAKKKYMNGLVSYDDWHSIENDYITHQKEMLSYKKKAIISKINWIQFLGKVSMRDKEDK